MNNRLPGTRPLPHEIDPFLVEVIRHALSAAAEEMSLVMTRSARSSVLREGGDLDFDAYFIVARGDVDPAAPAWVDHP